MARGRTASLGLILWLVIGVIVAAGHQYFDTVKTIGGILSALVAVVLWPLVLLGTHIAINI